MMKLFEDEKFDAVCRYSLTNPDAYEACRHNGVKNLSYASVYGLNEELPFSTMLIIQ
jgi:hypothetical protein